jgi:Tol biopolymer transport system component
VLTRFTFFNSIVGDPVWSPDGTRVVFALQDESLYSSDLYQKATTGSAGEELLLPTGINGRATDWSTDGTFIVYQQQESKTAVDIWQLPLEGDRKPVPYLQTGANEQNGRFYPGSTGPPRFMAYQSNESGRNQIYIQSIPTGAKFQVSADGGTVPHWRRDGRELYYLSADNRLMAVPITIGVGVQIGTPQELFMNASMTSYVPSRDGQRFLVNLPAGGESASGAEPITVVTNWQAGRAK